MPKLEITVVPKEGAVPPDEDTWTQFLLRVYSMTNDLAKEFPQLLLSLPVVKGSRVPRGTKNRKETE